MLRSTNSISTLSPLKISSPLLLSQIEEHLKTLTAAQRKEQVSKVKGVFQFNIKNSDGKVATWTFDLKSREGAMHKGTVTGLKPDITIDSRIKVKGAIMMATKLDSVFKGAQESTSFEAKL
ncbi:hypothetical protein BGZ59_002828 [Podila verticillata]|nr:hypothetical protein BGZ59_002828 [Podila verticillata]